MEIGRKIGRKSVCFAIMIVHPPGDDFRVSPPENSVVGEVRRCETNSIAERWWVGMARRNRGLS